MGIFEDQKDFMIAGGQVVDKQDEKQAELYDDLIDEEYYEFCTSLGFTGSNEEPKENQIKEAIDLIVVTAGWLNSQGIDAQKAWDLVHANNLKKVANLSKDSSGKVMKSEESIKAKGKLMEDIRGLI